MCRVGKIGGGSGEEASGQGGLPFTHHISVRAGAQPFLVLE